ncbi:MAG: hypothetical protein ACEPO8_05200 [Rhodothermaceae bacterium]
MNNYVKILFLFSILLVETALAQNFEFEGQISLWGTIYNQSNDYQLNGGTRFIPGIRFTKDFESGDFIDLHISANTFLYKTETDFFSEADLYRFKVRYATEQSELRLGLQKINFGPAKILRSLQWFDTVDPTDPIKITEGVYGLRYKYNFLNNSEIWLWVLYGNDKLKGKEFLVSDKKEPEFGGRISLPLFDGELAGTFHSRTVSFHNTKLNEKRFALDGRWEVEAGIWFESVFTKLEDNLLFPSWQNNFTIGSDYTFNIGNGLVVTGEHYVFSMTDKFFGRGKTSRTTALSAAYPLGLVDNFSLFVFYQWESDKLYQTFQWNRVYDSFILNFNFYNYPETALLAEQNSENNTRAGYGFQFMIIYNF